MTDEQRRSAARYLQALKPRPARGPGARVGFEATLGPDIRIPTVRQRLLDRVEATFARSDRGESPATAELVETRGIVLRGAEEGLARLARDGGDAALAPDERVGLEAVIKLTGRPSILIRDDALDIDPADPDVKQWLGILTEAAEVMKGTIRSVGRIDRDGDHIGTGFVVAPGVVMTNRHVLQDLAHARPIGGGKTSWTFLGGSPTIDFAVEYGSERTRRFALGEVIFAGPRAIDDHADLTRLDLALLSVATTSEDGHPLPPPLPLAKNPAPSKRAGDIYVVGYPARPQVPTGGGARDVALVDTLRRVFRMRYGYKRLAIGNISVPLGTVPDDTAAWTLGYDATTLGGNSGSCVVGLDDDGPVLGLHFGGRWFDFNLAHVLAAVPPLAEAPVAGLGIVWR